ncbi:hypothetical protein L195_g034477 [Trifolium pratense]|uniref:Uncharacterized protein n=1 Tax=Trifolium pratense TaxID=57577 RepID=A0A2K3LJ25_TRIPR|nr:hypothetical protein L195_g034477 [Trifolium pratense]
MHNKPLMEPHVVAEDIHDVEKLQEGIVVTTTIDLNAQAITPRLVRWCRNPLVGQMVATQQVPKVSDVANSNAMNDTTSLVAVTNYIDMHMTEAIFVDDSNDSSCSKVPETHPVPSKSKNGKPCLALVVRYCLEIYLNYAVIGSIFFFFC